MPPSRCCSSVKRTLKSSLKSLLERRRPRERPTHPLLERLELRERRARHRRERDVVILEVDGDPVEPVRDARAGRASRGVVGSEHEMVDDELRPPSEQIGQRGAAAVGVESIVLVDCEPTAAPAAAARLRRCAASAPSLPRAARAAPRATRSRVPVACFVMSVVIASVRRVASVCLSPRR